MSFFEKSILKGFLAPDVCGCFFYANERVSCYLIAYMDFNTACIEPSQY